MNKISGKTLNMVAGVVLALVITTPGIVTADGNQDNGPKKWAVSGAFDWSIVPANLGPYLLNGTDGDLYLRSMPLVGVITITGEKASIQGKISTQLNGELDATGTGVLWVPWS